MGPFFLLAAIWIAVPALANIFDQFAGSIYAAGISASVTVGLFWASRAQSRRQATLDLHKEYYSVEFAKHRSGASKFMKKYKEVDWSQNDPYWIGDGDDDLEGYAIVIRFFHRFAILYEEGEINRTLAVNLFAKELGYWAERLFHPMEKRTGMNTLPSILELSRRAALADGSGRFAQGRKEARQTKPPEIMNATGGTIESKKVRWSSL